MNHFFSILSESNEQKYGGSLSILLLGSMSRGEATQMTMDGRVQILSDIEFFTVFPDGFSAFQSFTEDIKRASFDAFGEDNLNLFHVDNTYVRKSSLSQMERKLLTYDATRTGRCVVGKDVVPLLPKITIDNINWCDIWDIMTHRAFSVLYYGFPLKHQGMEDAYRYSIAKNSLDLMTVILVSKGYLESGFVRRLKLLQSLGISKEWLDYFDYCLNIKQGITSDCLYSTTEMEQIFGDILQELTDTFHIPIQNVLRNALPVLRRRMGMVKRALYCRQMPLTCRKHLNNLIACYKKKTDLDQKTMSDNYILHGYPAERS